MSILPLISHTMDTTRFEGSTSEFRRVQKGVVLKYPRQILRESKLYEVLTRDVDTSFSVELQILEILEHHLRIEIPWGKQWRRGPARHSPCRGQSWRSSAILGRKRKQNLPDSPQKMVSTVHETMPAFLDLWLCDFGGSKCDELGIYGGHLPDSGFLDPRSEPIPKKQMDIFQCWVGSLCHLRRTLAIPGTWAFQDARRNERVWAES